MENAINTLRAQEDETRERPAATLLRGFLRLPMSLAMFGHAVWKGVWIGQRCARAMSKCLILFAVAILHFSR